MQRYDLRHLKDDFYDRMVELIDQGVKSYLCIVSPICQLHRIQYW